MIISPSENSGWDPRPVDELIRKQRQTAIDSNFHTLHDVSYVTNPPVNDDLFQHPVVRINDISRLHLVPICTGLLILLTDTDTAQIKSLTRQDCDFYLTHEGRVNVAKRLEQAFHSDFTAEANLRSDLVRTFQKTECFSDPFDTTTTRQFRPPIVRWLRSRTVAVQYSGTADPENPSSNPNWHIELKKSGEADGTRTIKIPHEKFLSGQESVFRTRYKRAFARHKRIRLSVSGWLDLSQFFIDEAEFNGVDPERFEDKTRFDVEYRQSGKGTFHLTPHGEATAFCECSVRSSTTRPFDPSIIPLPSAICVNCAKEIKLHRMGEHVQDR